MKTQLLNSQTDSNQSFATDYSNLSINATAINNIGEEHNKILDYIKSNIQAYKLTGNLDGYSYISFIRKTIINYITSSSLNENNDFTAMFLTKLFDVYDNNTMPNLFTFDNSMVFTEISNIINTYCPKNFTEETLKALQLSFPNLSPLESTVIQAMTSVSIHSTNYWNSNIYSWLSLINNPVRNVTGVQGSELPNWVRSDGAGASIGASTWWVVAIPGLLGVAGTAAYASATYLIKFGVS